MKNLIPKKPDTDDIGIQVGDEDVASDDDGASESSTEETEQSKPMVVRSAMPRLTMVAMETVHITPDRPFSADSHLLPVLNKTQVTPSKLVSSELSSSVADIKSSSITSISEEPQLDENQNEKTSIGKEKTSPRKKKTRKSSIRQSSSKDLLNESQKTEISEENHMPEKIEREETGNAGSNVASITIVHKDSLLKSTSVQTDSIEDASISVTKSPKKVTKKGKLIKKSSSDSIKDRLFFI